MTRALAAVVLAALVLLPGGLAAAQPKAFTPTTCPSCGHSRFPMPGACIADAKSINPRAKGCCAGKDALQFITRLVDVLGGELKKQVTTGSAQGNSPFGGAVLGPGPDYKLVHVDHNRVVSNNDPVAHGETTTITSFSQAQARLPADQRMPPEAAVFVATHQPCPMCASAIGWAGFRRVVYGFDFTANMNGKILDVPMVEQFWHSDCGAMDHTNGFYTMLPLEGMLQMQACNGDKAVQAALDGLRAKYGALKKEFKALGDAFQRRIVAAKLPQANWANECKDCHPFPRDECSHGLL